MKLGIELGLKPLKTENREGTEALREVHHNINGILYQNTYRYIDPKLAGAMYDQLVALGKKLNETSVPEKARAKKEELLSKLRMICKTLGEERKKVLGLDDVPQMQKAINGYLHTYITAKTEDRLDDDTVLMLLEESKRLYNTYYNWAESLKTDTLIKSNSELLSIFEKKYGVLV